MQKQYRLQRCRCKCSSIAVILCRQRPRRLWFNNDCYASSFYSAAWLCNEQHGLQRCRRKCSCPAIVLRGQRPRRLWLSNHGLCSALQLHPLAILPKPGTATMPMRLLIPGAAEICGNGIDDNCNGQVDENCTAACQNATNLTTTGITSNSATFNWTASANPTQWRVQYKALSRVRNGSMLQFQALPFRNHSFIGCKPKLPVAYPG